MYSLFSLLLLLLLSKRKTSVLKYLRSTYFSDVFFLVNSASSMLGLLPQRPSFVHIGYVFSSIFIQMSEHVD